MKRAIAYLVLLLLSSCSFYENSSDATLKSLETTSGTLTPEFSPKETDYTIAVNSGVFTLTPITANSSAYLVLKINDQPYKVITDDERINIELEIGENTILFKVIAEDGSTTKIYKIVVDATPVFTFGGYDTQAISSGLTIKNTSPSTKTVTGFYFTSLDPGSTSPCFGNIVAGANLFGALWSPIEVPAHEKVSLDQTYLYNAMANFLYQIIGVVGSIPVDTPGGMDSWCVTIGLASETPAAQLMNDNIIGPMTHNTVSGDSTEEVIISCDDATFTCMATPAVNQLFPR